MQHHVRAIAAFAVAGSASGSPSLFWDGEANRCRDESDGRLVNNHACLTEPDPSVIAGALAEQAPWFNDTIANAKANAGGLNFAVGTTGLTPTMLITPAVERCLEEHGTVEACVRAGLEPGRPDGRICERVRATGGQFRERFDVYTPRLKSGGSFVTGCGGGWGGLVYSSCDDGEVTIRYFCESCGDVDDEEACEHFPGCTYKKYFYIFTICKFDEAKAVNHLKHEKHRHEGDEL